MLQHVRALIPAAGLSVRFGGTMLKQYAHLCGKPVLAHSIEAVRRHSSVISVTVATANDDGIYDELIRPLYPEVSTIVGGVCRAQTVLNGLDYIRSIDPDCYWVLVHDAARPCLSAESLEDLILQGMEDENGAILAIPVSDTLKRIGESRHIDHTVDRSYLWAAQTPQLFPLDTLRELLGKAMCSDQPPTDEAEAMERGGFHPLLVRGQASNIKITGADDLPLAEWILRQRTGAHDSK